MKPLTLDLVARYPRPGLSIPAAFRFSPDGATVTYLHSQEGSLRRVLWAMDVASGDARVLFAPGEGVTDENVSREEALRRERERLLHTGVTHYEWAEDAPVIVVPLPGELWLVDGSGTSRRIGGDALDPHLNTDGTAVAFVRGGNLWTLDVAGGVETQLTHDAVEGITNGLAEYIAQEELARARGFWWSRDGAWLAYQQTDERHIPAFRIPHWGAASPYDVEEHRYPFAGADNVRVRLGIVPARGGDTRWLELPPGAEYVARAAWSPDGRLFVQTLNRAQDELELRAYAHDGSFDTLLVERSDVWINVHDDLRFVEADGSFVWSSERAGMKQLELRAPDGTLVRALTDHAFPVDGVIALTQSARRVTYLAGPTPVEQHVFAVSLDGGEPERLTAEPGMHSGSVGDEAWIHLHHARTQPPRVVLRARDREHVVHDPDPIDFELATPELFSFRNADGVELHGAFHRPAVLPAPLIAYVYGGPHAQNVTDGWTMTVDLRAQYLRAQGFGVLVLDNRGSARRGLAFEGWIKHRMGTLEIDDQVAGVRYAQQQGWVDGDRVGIYGWSYGGTMTIMSMLKAPDVFRVGVAGAPVTEWEGYDTGYTERYMGMPHQNPDGYREGSALTHVESLRGKLMIIHGMIDENVHFRHTARFLDALQKTDGAVDLIAYPDERHMPRSEKDRRNMEGRIVEYFRANL